ncbi:MAG: putative Hybrid histidine kinase, partial [Pseudobdellovibrio sp.]|nr:putative Hybrid histidine kinase [Pseudobdellovibrio sp.]
WIAALLFGKDPDFRKSVTWKKYFAFVILFMLIEPILWGYICADKYTAEISYRSITPALFFTTSLTWIIAPFAMLIALPAAKKFGLFWADIPLHTAEHLMGKKQLVWFSGNKKEEKHFDLEHGVPIRIMLVAPFFVLILSLVLVTAYFTLKSSGNSAHQLAIKLHEEVTESVKSNIKTYLGTNTSAVKAASLKSELDKMLKKNSIAGNGRAFIIDRRGSLIASSKRELSGDKAELKFVDDLSKQYKGLKNISKSALHRFDIIKTKPLAKETWLVQVAPFAEPGESVDWLIVTALPQNYYLQGVRTGSSQSALVFSVALILVMLIVGLLSKVVTLPLRKISAATKELAAGRLSTTVPGSHIQELNTLSLSFNQMAANLKQSIEALHSEIIKRINREKALEEAQNQIQENETRLRMSVKAADLGVWDWDMKTGELYWDEGMFRHYGMSEVKPHWKFDDWFKFVLPEDKEAIAEQVRNALKNNREYTVEYRVKWQDGSIHYLRGVGRACMEENGRATRMVGVNFDITELKTAEQKLIESRDEALKANLAKSEFLANMSHEIRTPLNTILGMSSVLNETPLNENQKKCVDILVNSSEHLLLLINDIIDANIIETKGITLDKSSFDLPKLITSTVEFLSVAASKKRIRLFADIGKDVPQCVIGDEHRLRQILINLVGNAVKFTEKGSVELVVENVGGSSDPYSIRFSIKDTGIGIAPAQQKLIFERFIQGNSSLTRKHEGTGLGLSITKYLVERMGSKINMNSEPGKGSCFYFTLLMQPGVMKAQKPQAEADTSDLQNLNILIVDDSPDNRTLMQYYLNKTKCHLETACDGSEAIKKFQNGHYDLIFMDIQMPGVDGYKATREIRKIENEKHLKHTPIAALTAFALKEEEQKSFDAG